jgi:hypothetical protein
LSFPHLSEKWKQPVVIEYRPGANTNIGTVVATKAELDSHTLLFSSDGTFIFNPLIYSSMPYSVSELAPVSLVATIPHMLAVGRMCRRRLSLKSSRWQSHSRARSTTGLPGLGASSGCKWNCSWP